MLKERTRHSLLRVHRIIILLFVILIPWQLYIRVFSHVDLPLSVFIGFAGIAFTAYTGGNVSKAYLKMKWPVLGYGLMLAAISVSSLIHASHNLFEAANLLGRLGIGLLTFIWVGLIQNMNDTIMLRKETVVKVFLISVFPLGVMGILFYSVPDLENTWLRVVSGVLIEADSALTRSNILSDYRTGVVFMNANVAGIFWGISMWLALWMKQKTPGLSRVAYTTCAVLFCFNVLATASRAALLALVSTAFISIIIQTLCSHNKLMSFRQASSNIIIIAITLMSAFALQSIDFADGGIMHRISQDAGEHEVSGHPQRSLLWAHAVTVIRQAPIAGHGVVDFAVLDFPMGFPPHNSILQVWIYGGLIAVIGLLCLFFTVGWQMIRKLQHDYTMWLPIIILAWVIIQAMFTNLPISDFRIAMSLWLIVSLFLWSPQYRDTVQKAN